MRPLFPAAELPGLPPLTRAWLRGEPAVAPFLPPPRPRAATTIPTGERSRPWEPFLASVARRNEELGNPAALPLVDALRAGAVAVVAGQQVGLFGGPLLALVKGLEAVRIAARLTAAGTPAVPVFWMATEDHDLAEVLDARWPAPDETVRFDVPADAAANRRPVGVLPIGPGPAAFLAARGESVPPRLAAALAPETTYAASFAAHLLEGLAGRPILLVEPSLPEAKWNLSDLFARLLRGAQQVSGRLSERERAIQAAGFDLQVVHRPGQCHLFLLDGGERRPLDRFDDGSIGPRDGEPSERRPAEEWARLAEEHPDRFSPAVLARPAAASRLLPQAVAVLGPAEVAYWAQSVAVFEESGIPLPDLAPRPHVFLLEATTRRLLERLGVSVAEVLGGVDGLLRELARRDVGGPLARFRAATVAVRHHLAELEGPLGEIDPTLRGVHAHAAEKIGQQINLMIRKGEDAAARKDETRARQAARLVAILAPEGIPQERHDALLPWLSRAPDLGEAVADALADAPDGTVVGVELGRSASEGGEVDGR